VFFDGVTIKIIEKLICWWGVTIKKIFQEKEKNTFLKNKLYKKETQRREKYLQERNIYSKETFTKKRETLTKKRETQRREKHLFERNILKRETLVSQRKKKHLQKRNTYNTYLRKTLIIFKREKHL